MFKMHSKLMTKAGTSRLGFSNLVQNLLPERKEHGDWRWAGEVAFQVPTKDPVLMSGDRASGDNKSAPNSFFSLPPFFPDPEELFVPTENYYEMVQLRSHQPVLLPCQVTNPLAQVTLHREFPPEEVPVDGTDISFDVKKGFTIHRPQASLAGSLFCLASLGGIRQISTKYMLIYIKCA